MPVEKCVEIKGRLCLTMAKLFYFCHLKKLVSPGNFWTVLRTNRFYLNVTVVGMK